MSDIPSVNLDEIDQAILQRLQKDGRISNAKLADEVGLTETPCWRRIRRMEKESFITGYRAELNRRRLGFGVLAIVEVKFSVHGGSMGADFESAVQKLPQILTCYNVTGETDYVLQVVAKDLDDYGRFTTLLRHLPGVTAIHSSLVLREIKAFQGFPIPEG